MFIPLIITGKNKRFVSDIAQGKHFPSFKESLQMLGTFVLVLIGWVIFRSDSILDAGHYLINMIQWESLRAVYLFFSWEKIYKTSFAILLMLFMEWTQRHEEHPLNMKHVKSRAMRWIIYLALILAFFAFQVEEDIQFIYFQF